MDLGYIFLFVILSIGLLAKSGLLVLASIILALIKISGFDFLLISLEEKGIKLGLLFLLISVMVPMVDGSLSLRDIFSSYKSVLGIFALISGLIATKVVGVGLVLLDSNPELIVAMLFGSIIGIVFLDGVPVGPLFAAGLTALFYRLYSFLLL
ncbi:DUF441 domain-containing protein [Halonatronum saccharophilum]|uniref:DUF441 domain-containing protein n=1 Tax=Halonatronum saccharophilum TaxID=150060 RepID=UPI0004B6313A|nr:DUF441 domain-containing protein [Halonatronum saccharophilum]